MIKLVSWQSWVQTSTKDWLTAELLAGEIRDQREHVKHGIQVAGYFQAEREELKDMYRVRRSYATTVESTVLYQQSVNAMNQ